jgi:hypothetical protein
MGNKRIRRSGELLSGRGTQHCGQGDVLRNIGRVLSELFVRSALTKGGHTYGDAVWQCHGCNPVRRPRIAHGPGVRSARYARHEPGGIRMIRLCPDGRRVGVHGAYPLAIDVGRNPGDREEAPVRGVGEADREGAGRADDGRWSLGPRNRSRAAPQFDVRRAGVQELHECASGARADGRGPGRSAAVFNALSRSCPRESRRARSAESGSSPAGSHHRAAASVAPEAWDPVIGEDG